MKKKKKYHSYIFVLLVLFLMVTIVGIGMIKQRKILMRYEEQAASLQEEIQSEKERQKEIDSLEEYVKTDEYIKEVAREKLGLIDPNEIIFKPNK
ncbi:FtsB family cell division protein [Mediterraneibacter gnavus]|uniref:FtsB family cell division protein n=1 Tax=Mediterraneibacter gnavus TaxID=33038 RepID=UPI001F40B4A8|nr:septum formation initiator family protein [Mediterraneibacter gnavus]